MHDDDNAGGGSLTHPAAVAERDILRRALEGTIRVCPDTAEVSFLHGGQRRWRSKKPDFHQGRARYRFGKARATVYRNRVVFIIHNRRLPDGFVDHLDGDKTNDRPDNLADQSIEDSHRQGNEIQTKRVLKELCEWFEYMGS